jgi:SAM-dependent methyltransferase
MLSLPYQDESLDGTVSYHSFNYVPFDQQGRALSEQHRVLRKEGTLVLAAFPAEHRANVPIVLERHGESFILYPRTKDELKALLAQAGFFCIHDDAPVCTEEERAHASESLQPLIKSNGGRFAQLIVAVKV